MDKLNNFSKELKDRLSNPLFFSFIISWLFFNWKIIIGICLYNLTELKIDGYNSYIDLISKNVTTSNTIYKPLLMGTLYTFVFPFLRNCIYAFNSWIKAWGNVWNLNISKSSKVSMSKYIELREIYQKRTELLEEVLENESKFLKENEELKNNNLILIKEKNEVLADLQDWKSINNVNILNGEWEYSTFSKQTNQRTIEKLHIQNGLIQILSAENTKSIKDEIKNFYYSRDAKQMSFVIVFIDEKTSPNPKKKYLLNLLDVLSDGNVLRGYINDELAVEYKKYN